MKKSVVYALVFAVFLSAFTAYSLLDTFVIPREIISVLPDSQETTDASSNTESETTQPPETEFELIIDDNTYDDGNVRVEITEYREFDTAIYVADVVVSSPEFLKTAFAKNTYGRNVRQDTSVIAIDHDAILAVNGDFYGARNDSYVVRGGVIYRERSGGREDLVIYEDGSFGIAYEDSISAAALVESGAREVISFGPALVIDGKVSVQKGQEVAVSLASNPRTAIGIIEPCHYIFVVSDGRTDESDGLTLIQLATFMKNLGATIAYNLDGGGSTSMVFNGEIVNIPTTTGKNVTERSVSDIVYIGY